MCRVKPYHIYLLILTNHAALMIMSMFWTCRLYNLQSLKHSRNVLFDRLPKLILPGIFVSVLLPLLSVYDSYLFHHYLWSLPRSHCGLSVQRWICSGHGMCSRCTHTCPLSHSQWKSSRDCKNKTRSLRFTSTLSRSVGSEMDISGLCVFQTCCSHLKLALIWLLLFT